MESAANISLGLSSLLQVGRLVPRTIFADKRPPLLI
jgi:hypothetical protein